MAKWSENGLTMLMIPFQCLSYMQGIGPEKFDIENLPRQLVALSSLFQFIMSSPAYYELYRRSTLGLTLTDALDTLITDQKIQPQLANRILNNFDRIISELLKTEANIAKSKLTFKGDLHTYRFCDDVWTFIIKNVIIKMTDVSGNENNDNEINVDKFKIVACNSRKAGES